jgi:hypothetical protein
LRQRTLDFHRTYYFVIADVIVRNRRSVIEDIDDESIIEISR